MTSTVDLFPTILDLAGVSAPRNQGRSLLNWVRSGREKPLRNEIYAQIGDYHGFIGTSWPTGMPASGRHASLTHCIRTRSHVYIIDPDNGDEAYDLVSDPNELNNLLNRGSPELDDTFVVLRQRLLDFIADCAELQSDLGVVRGDRGFVEGWE